MKPKELEDVMVSFYHHEFDLLLCTTIIENGLDIQNANTIIINRSDKLGLSQIHQIRGRVGRCSVQAYAYILFPMEHQLTDESKERLQALKEAVGLGGGVPIGHERFGDSWCWNLVGGEAIRPFNVHWV